jgi:hypothetical protein
MLCDDLFASMFFLLHFPQLNDEKHIIPEFQQLNYCDNHSIYYGDTTHVPEVTKALSTLSVLIALTRNT